MGYSVKTASTARPLLFKLVLSSDHVTGATGKSPTVVLSKNGAAFGAPAGAVTEVANGWYAVAGNATDTGTLGPLVLYATAALCDPADDVFEVVAYDPADAVGLGLSAVPANLVLIQGATFLADAAVPVDLTQAIGDTQTDGTLGAALLGMEAEARGTEVIDVVAKTYTRYRQDGVTVVDVFDLDSATTPTTRTPR